MLPDGPLKRNLLKSAKFRAAIINLVPIPPYDSTRDFLAYGLAVITRRHQTAIHSLIFLGNFVSAQALLRTCVESSLRSFWVLHVATEIEINRIGGKAVNKQPWPKLEALIGRIEGHYKAPDLKIKGGLIKTLLPPPELLNDLTHAGQMLIVDAVFPPPKTKAREQIDAITGRNCVRISDRMIVLSTVALHLRFGTADTVDEITRLYGKLVESYESIPNIDLSDLDVREQEDQSSPQVTRA